MATSLILRVDFGKLMPASAHDQEALVDLGFGKEYSAKLTSAKPRSVAQNRFYWVLLGKVVENQKHYRRAEQLHVWIKVRLGYVEEMVFHDGRTATKVSSTAFDAMDNHDFRKYMDAAIDVLVTEIIPGLQRTALIREVENMLGISYESLWVEKRRAA